MSEPQEAQLVDHLQRVASMLDGNEAGRKVAGEVAGRLAPKLYVRIVDLPEGKQPDQLPTAELQKSLTGA